jgi:hypothetical protein
MLSIPLRKKNHVVYLVIYTKGEELLDPTVVQHRIGMLLPDRPLQDSGTLSRARALGKGPAKP